MKGRRSWTKLLALLMPAATACSGFSVSTSASPTPSHSPSPSGSPTATASPSPAVLSCRLPVASGDAPIDGKEADGSKGKGGFVAFPAATFAADPASEGSYDLSAGKWLPAPRAWISPDGRHFTYPEYRTEAGPVTGIIHIVDIPSGADHTVGVPAPSSPVDYATEGIYVHQVVPNSGAPPSGLTIVHPDVPDFHQISADAKAWMVVGSGFAWGIDPPPAAGSPPPKDNKVIRLELSSGSTSTYLQRADAGLSVRGLDSSGSPVVGAYTNTNYLVLIGGSQVFSGSLNDNANPTGNVVADSHGLWISSLSGALWLYSPAAGMRRVAETGLQNFQVAGGCT